MTKFFEVTRRDGAARIGRLLVRGGIETPYIVSPGSPGCVIVNGCNAWTHSRLENTPDSFTIQPYKGLPYHVRDDLAEIFAPDKEMRSEMPSGVVVHPLQKVKGADMYVMAGARSIEGEARAILDSFIKIRDNTPPDTALYVPAMATPENIALLLYLGADVVDDVLPTIKAYQGIYLTVDGEYRVKDMERLPCMCDVCKGRSPKDLLSIDLLAAHNSHALREEIERIKLHVEKGMLREYIEKQCRSRPWLTALLRLADVQYDYIEERTPAFRSSEMLACSAESQNRVEVRRFAARVNERVSCEGDILLVIPCSARKPYSSSQSHIAILNAIKKYRSSIREAILTSPLGVVPRELELVYPAAHYDVAVTGYWDLEERHWVSDCLKAFIMKNKFKKIIAHVEGPYVEVCKDTGIEMEFTSKGRVSDDASLQSLNDALDAAVMSLNPARRGYERSRMDTFRMMADYQFGKGKGDLLVPENGIIKGKPPRLALFDGREQLCQIIPEFGSLTLTIEGARRALADSSYTVEIADFTPKGSILAPGVLKADHMIRPGDDVFVKGSKAIAVGKAKMGGCEMAEATRGIAVELRHVEKLS